MFKVTGKINDTIDYIEYNWEDGIGCVSGGRLALFCLGGELESTTPVGPVGQYMERDINIPLAAFSMILNCFDEIISCEGEIPQAASVPEGAIC